jgi:peptidoglycan/LPS O-acetylase OafA/YrhL
MTGWFKFPGHQESTVNNEAQPGHPKNMLPSIQWLRAIAAIMVAIHHAIYYGGLLGQPSAAQASSGSFWSFGIHIFFVVSGFIMIHTTYNFGEAGAWRVFLARRLIRVVPLYWVLTTVMVVGIMVSPHSLDIATDKLRYILGSYFFIPVLRAEGDLRPILGQGWTLDYEMFFYVVFALAVMLPRRWGVSLLTLGFVGLTWLGRDLGKDTPVIFTWTDGIILEFLFGVFVGLAYEKNWRLPGWAAVICILSGTVVAIMDLPGATALIAGLPAALIVGGFVLGPQMKDSLASAWLTRVGDASYSLYLTHVFVLKAIYVSWAAAIGARLPVPFYILSSILASIVVGLLVYHLVERPMTNYLQRKLLRTSRHRASFPARTAEARP